MRLRVLHHISLLVWVVLIALVPSESIGVTYLVRADGSGDFPTIQEAIDGAAAGDTIEVGPGRYPVHLWIESKSIVIRSSSGPEATVLTGESRRDGGPVVHFFYVQGDGGALEGFSVEDGETGVQCTSASPLIRNNVIRRNQSALGAGICCLFESHARIVSNRIVDNRASYHCCFPSRGGGIYSDDTSFVVIRGNLVAGNKCAGECIGGGISCFTGEIEGNTIVGNSADGPAGGVELPYLGVTFFRNIVAWNRSSEFGDGVVVFRSADLFCNDIWGNGSEDYWGIEPGHGDFSADPRFCAYPGPVWTPSQSLDSADFALRAESPCIPGNHPLGVECGLVGAYPEGCTRGATAVASPTVSLPISQIYPNPTRGPAIIRLAARNDPAEVVKIFDAGGRRVAAVAPDPTGLARWSGRTEAGEPVAPGVYFARTGPPGGPAASILVVR